MRKLVDPVTVDSIIDALGGVAAVGRLLRVTAQAVWNMKSRGSIPPEYWCELVAEGARLEIGGLSLEAFAEIAARRRPEPAVNPVAAA